MTWTPWIQVYDPLGSPWLSTAAAALPIVLLLVALARPRVARAPRGARRARLRAGGVGPRLRHAARRPRRRRRSYGAAYGFLPIGWIILNAVFLYNLTVETGQFEIVKASVGRLSSDRRIQALLVAFSFGAFIEGASGFGTPVAICSALLIGLGFTPLYAAGLSLIANTAPVAFGAIGTPILTLGGRHRHSGADARHDGGPPAAVRVADRAGVARRDDERLARAARRLAGRAGLRRHVRRRAVCLEQLRRPRARGHRRRPGRRSRRWRCSARVAAARRVGVPGSARRPQA